MHLGFGAPVRSVKWPCQAWLRVGERAELCVCQVPGKGEVSANGISFLQASKVPVPAGAGVGSAGVGGASPRQEESRGREGPWECPQPCSGRNLALLPPGVPESTSCMEMCGSYFSTAIRHVSGQQDSGVFSVPAFWSLGSRQGSRERVGLMELWRPGQRRAVSWRVKGHVGLWLNVAEGSCSSGRIITTAY